MEGVVAIATARQGRSLFEPGTIERDIRSRFADAVTRVASERGFANTDAELIAADAGLSVAEFYEHYEDERQCLLSAFDCYLDRLQRHMEEAWSEEADWPRLVKAAIHAGLDFVSELERPSRVFALDAIGPAATDRRVASIERAAQKLREGRALAGPRADYPEVTEMTLVSGIVVLVYTHLLAEEGSLIPSRTDEIVEMVLTPYVGARRARRLART